MSNIEFLATLETIVLERIANPPEGSYTARLLEQGTKRVAQKVGEEGVELALAAVSGDRDELVDEAADLFYHVLVLLNGSGVSLSDVSSRLEQRHKPR